MNRVFKSSLLVALLALPPAAVALELFGVALETGKREVLRDAARKVGHVLIREGGDDDWFDIYDSRLALRGSNRFYLGFVKNSLDFAFAEYEFNGLAGADMLQKLTDKYGAAQALPGRYISDRTYLWRRDGIEIRLQSDWQAYKTRLSYVNPGNLASLLAEREATSKASRPEAETVSLY